MPIVDITIADFTAGLNTLLDEGRLPMNAARDVTNMMQVQDGVWTKRWGTMNYGASLGGPVDGISVATKVNSDGSFTQYLLACDNGVLKISADGGSWTSITGFTFTVGNHISMVQIKNRVYLANGVDHLAYYDIVAGTIFVFSGLTTPGSATLALHGLIAGSVNAYYRISAVNLVGETIAGTEATITINKQRNAWVNNTSEQDYITLTWTNVTGATRYNIYYSDTTGQENYLDSVGASASASTSYQDDGTASPNDFYPAPVGDTTVGPIVSWLALSDNRLWGCGDPGNPQRVYWSGTGQYIGAASPFYGGGYIDLEKGGPEKPTSIAHYRDGKGDSMATVFTTQPDGTGSEWQLQLASQTIGVVTFVVPTATKIVGSTGTNSPMGILEARNNIYFPSTRGWYTLGSKPNVLYVLSTDQISVPIRPDVYSLNNSQSRQICGIQHIDKLFWSVPKGSIVNNEIWVLDLEQNAWSRPWTIGIQQFILYTSSDGVIHMLGLPVGSTQLVEFSERFTSDNGVSFPTTYRSGLIHFDKNHRAFAKVRYVYVELARPSGTITFTLSGTPRNKAFQAIKSRDINTSGTNFGTGYSAEPFSQILYSRPVSAPESTSQSSVKKLITINKILNNMQFEVTSDDASSIFSINQFMAYGHIVNTAPPSSWKK
jgi:hypothetical protein